jgi:ribonuclease-3
VPDPIPLSAIAGLTERLDLPALPGALLAEALTHSSLLNEAGGDARSNERLEYLGDAVLDMVIAQELFNRFPDAGEGALTRMRAALVRRDAIARVARRIELGQHLVMGRGEEGAGGRTRARNLAGVFEALIGAVFQELGYEQARAFIVRLMAPELETVGSEAGAFDAKSRLQELVQARWHQPPHYTTVGEQVRDDGVREFVVEVRVDGRVMGEGRGHNKRDAQQRAAAAAVGALEAATEGDGHAP